MECLFLRRKARTGTPCQEQSLWLTEGRVQKPLLAWGPGIWPSRNHAGFPPEGLSTRSFLPCPSYAPLGRSLVISRTKFPVCKLLRTAGSSEISCVHKTKKCPQLGFSMRCPLTSPPNVPKPCAATQRSTCLGLLRVCLLLGLIPAKGSIAFPSYTYNKAHLVSTRCAHWLNGGKREVHLKLSQNSHCGRVRSLLLVRLWSPVYIYVVFRYFI